MSWGHRTNISNVAKTKRVRIMNGDAINNMNTSLLNIDWSTLEHMEVNEASEYLITKIQTTLDIFAPERTIRVSQTKTSNNHG